MESNGEYFSCKIPSFDSQNVDGLINSEKFKNTTFHLTFKQVTNGSSRFINLFSILQIFY